MPTYSIQGPDGKTYSIEGPEGATREQVIEAIKKRVDFSSVTSPTQPPTVQTEPEQPTEGVAQEFFEGIGSGLIAIPQGILELGASAVDLAADTDYASSVTEAATKLRDFAGIDPEGLIGKGSEAIVQFVIPGLGAASAVSKLSKSKRY